MESSIRRHCYSRLLLVAARVESYNSGRAESWPGVDRCIVISFRVNGENRRRSNGAFVASVVRIELPIILNSDNCSQAFASMFGPAVATAVWRFCFGQSPHLSSSVGRSKANEAHQVAGRKSCHFATTAAVPSLSASARTEIEFC